MKKRRQRVVVGMSGGVDSAVAAYLLKEQGYEVVGVFMKNWEEGEECPAFFDYQDVVAVSGQLEIPHYAVNFSKEYQERVFAHVVREYAAGHTPNPDILCNREIKFKVFLEKAWEIGADFLATGHYARIEEGRLLRGCDSNKDQSYFLYTLKDEQLRKILFPVGALPKSEVRRLASRANLAVAHKKDSTGICFIGKRDFKEFISRYIPRSQGPIETLDGKVIGEHDGIAYYTIGQRKGLNIGGQGDAWFIVAKDRQRNALIAVQGETHPALFAPSLIATDITWVSHPPTLPLHCTAKIRYRSPDAPCTLSPHPSGLLVHFASPQKAITSRQSIVFYDGPTCLGGALISHPVNNK